MACLDIKWNSCACVITAMYKQDILCKFLNMFSKKTKQMHWHRIRLHNLYIWQSLKEHNYSCADFKSRKNKTKQEQKIPKQLHISVSFVVFTLGIMHSEDSVWLRHSSCFLRKNCNAESHWSLGKRFDNSQ